MMCFHELDENNPSTSPTFPTFPLLGSQVHHGGFWGLFLGGDLDRDWMLHVWSDLLHVHLGIRSVDPNQMYMDVPSTSINYKAYERRAPFCSKATPPRCMPSSARTDLPSRRGYPTSQAPWFLNAATTQTQRSQQVLSPAPFHLWDWLFPGALVQ